MTIYVLTIIALLSDGQVVADAISPRAFTDLQSCVAMHERAYPVITRDAEKAGIVAFSLQCESINLPKPKAKGEVQL